MNCNIPLFLANLMASYCIASILYLLITRITNIGTPFNDALKKYPELIKIKNKSVEKRRNIFVLLLLLLICIMYIFSPFDECIATETELFEGSPDICNRAQDIFVVTN